MAVGGLTVYSFILHLYLYTTGKPEIYLYRNTFENIPTTLTKFFSKIKMMNIYVKWINTRGALWEKSEGETEKN